MTAMAGGVVQCVFLGLWRLVRKEHRNSVLWSRGSSAPEQDNQSEYASKREQRPGERNRGKSPRANVFVIYFLIALVLIGLQYLWLRPSYKEISWRYFARELAPTGDVARLVVVNREYVEIYIKPDSLHKPLHRAVARTWLGTPNPGPHYVFTIGSIDRFLEDYEQLREQLRQQNNTALETVDLVYETRSSWWRDILVWAVPVLLVILLWLYLMRRMAASSGAGIFQFGRSRPRIIEGTERVNVTFEDVAGLEEAKEEVKEIVDFLKNPEKYRALGGKIPKGVLLVGPPGTGKTLLAKAVAGEANVPFFSISGSEFVEMFVGVGASRVRDLFQRAREKAPCIIFIDEIDAIGRARGRYLIPGANDERESTLNQLLVEMDGFDSRLGIIVMAATNRPDVLDSALLRPGRFDRQIILDRPDLKGREAIFRIHMRPLKLAPDVDARRLAELTPGFVGADIANVCNEAALIAARKNKQAIEMEDFLEAIDKAIAGLKRKRVIAPEEKERVAYHEAGHTITAWYLAEVDPPYKVSIIPRSIGSLGHTQFLPRERYLYGEHMLYQSLVALLGGRAAEQLVYQEVSTGAQNDLERATQLAYEMVLRYGLGKKVRLLSFPERAQEVAFYRPFSEETARLVDEEVQQLLENAYEEALNLLRKYEATLHRLARALLEKETLVREDLVALIGEVPASEQRQQSAAGEGSPSSLASDPLSAASGNHGQQSQQGQSQSCGQEEEPVSAADRQRASADAAVVTAAAGGGATPAASNSRTGSQPVETHDRQTSGENNNDDNNKTGGRSHT